MVSVAITAEAEGESRVAASPDTVKKMVGHGWEVRVERGAGAGSRMSDDAYRDAGAQITQSRAATLQGADLWFVVRRPEPDALDDAGEGTLLAGMLDPFAGADALKPLAKSGVTSFAMEFMPRITRAQSMDVLSSQANLAGYKAVVDAAAAFGRALPMMMTAAGTVPAARVFVMGAGVAGLQAIATARRLGAVVTATDVRPAAKEQVNSLGAKFVAVEDEEFKQAETAAGYAKEMSDAYKAKQAVLVADHVANQDIVITTALIPGRPAPVLITNEMMRGMKAGSVIVDLAAERGGNCEGTQPGQVIEVDGIIIMGKTNLAGDIAGNASALYARNLLSFIESQIDKDAEGDVKPLAIDWEDEVITGTLLTKDGKIVHPRLTGDGN